MKSDFITIKQHLPGIVQVVSDFYQKPQRKGSVFFVKSPATQDRTHSLAIYPGSNRFTDFANGNYSGDIIGFISYIRGINNWEVLQILKDFYGLADSRGQDRQEAQRRIQIQQQGEHKKAERRQAFYTALWGEIDHLKHWKDIYMEIIEKQLYEPFSGMWCYCIDEPEKINYWLDVLCAADCKAYPRMKAYHGDLPSDRFKWLSDVLPVLAENGAFTATADELKEIKAQAAFETQRKGQQPGGVKLGGDIKEMKMPELICMADVEEKEIEWLVPGYIPKAHIAVLAGDGRTGKTTIWCGIVSALSSGNKVFFEDVPDEFIKRTSEKILFFSTEDSAEYTLGAKFRKNNANLKNILSVSTKEGTCKDIKFDSPVLEKLIKQERPVLIIFDPLQSFLPPKLNMAKRNEMRDCLQNLHNLAEKYNSTFLIICHTNKQSGVFGRKRIADSADIWDIARSVLIAGETNDGKRYLSHEKSSYSEPGETAIFTINDGIAAFEEYSDKKDRDFVMERDYNARQAPQRTDAEHFIYGFLRNGKKPAKELDEAAKAEGINIHTLRRAKENLKKRKLLGTTSTGYGKDKIFYSYLIDPFTK